MVEAGACTPPTRCWWKSAPAPGAASAGRTHATPEAEEAGLEEGLVPRGHRPHLLGLLGVHTSVYLVV